MQQRHLTLITCTFMRRFAPSSVQAKMISGRGSVSWYRRRLRILPSCRLVAWSMCSPMTVADAPLSTVSSNSSQSGCSPSPRTDHGDFSIKLPISPCERLEYVADLRRFRSVAIDLRAGSIGPETVPAFPGRFPDPETVLGPLLDVSAWNISFLRRWCRLVCTIQPFFFTVSMKS